MELRHGNLAKALEGQHAFKVGSVLKFIGMDYEEWGEETYIFRDDHNEIQHLIKEEFKWLEVAE
jgi:uncharacterized protein YdeI (BOF family)